MWRVCGTEPARGVRVGAQVSYRDLAGFGRRAMDVPAVELAAEVACRIDALWVFAEAAGSRVSYVKPHRPRRRVVTRRWASSGARADGRGRHDGSGSP
ncbi:hypothetical protein GCM10015535_46810 [Streptomyces gelaticus]|uniref:Uncharacterized protein n=1 Tax=Streptomyces gelaticus TaxID=285446 RepID=A0ABQ2W2W4_9ACTN|nr:hypothetical protein GCM10015535_46810 [Streptomyces gelaticus]